jgi:hypothetical protein
MSRYSRYGTGTVTGRYVSYLKHYLWYLWYGTYLERRLVIVEDQVRRDILQPSLNIIEECFDFFRANLKKKGR